MDEEETLEEHRDQLREAIRGAFYSLAEDDKGLQTHMVCAFVEYHMAADHEVLSIEQQVGIIGVVHTTILKMLHANPSSLQMAHAHAYIHALADSYLPSDDDDDEEPDMLLEEAGDDLDAWAKELAEYMREQEEEEPDGEEDTSDDDGEPNPGGDPSSE